MGGWFRTSGKPCFHYNPITFKQFWHFTGTADFYAESSICLQIRRASHWCVSYVYRTFTSVKNRLLFILTYSIVKANGTNGVNNQSSNQWHKSASLVPLPVPSFTKIWYLMILDTKQCAEVYCVRLTHTRIVSQAQTYLHRKEHGTFGFHICITSYDMNSNATRMQ